MTNTKKTATEYTHMVVSDNGTRQTFCHSLESARNVAGDDVSHNLRNVKIVRLSDRKEVR